MANFFDYINSGAFDDTVFHRLVSGFIIQGGGFTSDAVLNSRSTVAPVPITSNPDVPNEFVTSNTGGTIAMAKVGSNPNSATSQFFFNLADNSSNLDNQNGGFTVFGEIVGSSDQSVLNTLAAAPTPLSSNTTIQGDQRSVFANIPLNGYTGGSALTSQPTPKQPISR